MDVKKMEWSEKIGKIFRVPLERFSKIVQIGTIAGNIRTELAKETGLPETVQVIVGCHDQCAATLGSGCVAGGGQPFHGGDYEKVKARGAGLYAIDANKPKRKSHQNEDIKKLYAEFLGERGGHNAHTYLHTHYFDRSNPYAKKAEAECTAE